MSSILKALKKAENAQEFHRPKTLGAISRYSSNSTSSLTPGKLVMGGIIVILGSMVVYLSMRPPAVTPTPQIAPQQATEQSSKKALQPDSTLPPLARRPSPSAIAPANLTIPLSPLASTAAAGKRMSKLHTAGQAVQTTIAMKPPLPLPTSITAQPQVTSTTEPRLEVNGIAFQGENGSSIAVVNGVTVSKDSVVEGVTVEEIHPDRVSFRNKDKVFDVELGKISRKP